MSKTILILLISILAISCQTNKEKKIEKEKISLKGNWEYLGFGKAIIIGDSIVQSFHISKIGNVKTSDNTSSDFFNYYTVDTLSNDTILLKDGVKTFKLYRSDKDFSKNINTHLAKDPTYNFNILWNTFNEQYAYFNERDINWSSVYKKYESQVNPNTKPLELYLIFEKMLGEIKDSHISMPLPDDIEEQYRLQKEANNTENGSKDNGELSTKIRTKIVEDYLKEPRTFNRGSLHYGKLNNNIGYLEIQNMVTMAHYPIPDSLSKDLFYEKYMELLFNKAKNYHDDVRLGTRFMMDSIVRDIGNVKALIIDLRFNGGGFDDASVEILNHLASHKTDFSTKKVRFGRGFTEKQIMSLFPSKETFPGNVYILTSSQTASAAEILVLGAKELPNVTTIGATTEGVFSDKLDKKLPNGWTYTLSNMIYETMDGISYENIGIEPDFKLNYPRNSNDFYTYLYEDLKDGDDAIEKVIELENM